MGGYCSHNVANKSIVLSKLYTALDLLLKVYVQNNIFNINFNNEYNYELKDMYDLFNCLNYNNFDKTSDFEFYNYGYGYYRTFGLTFLYITTGNLIDISSHVEVEYFLNTETFTEKVISNYWNDKEKYLNKHFIQLLLLIMYILHIENELPQLFYRYEGIPTMHWNRHYKRSIHLDDIFKKYKNFAIPKGILFSLKTNVDTFISLNSEESILNEIDLLQKKILSNTTELTETASTIGVNNLNAKNILDEIIHLRNEDRLNDILKHQEIVNNNIMLKNNIELLKTNIELLQNNISNFHTKLDILRNHQIIKNLFDYSCDNLTIKC